MATPLPTNIDSDVLVSFVESLASFSASTMRMQQTIKEASGGNLGGQTTSGPSKSGSVSDASSALRSATQGVLSNIDTVMLFLCYPSSAIADPVSYFICSKADVVQLQHRVKWNRDILHQEQSQHNFMFCGDARVKLAYQRFVSGCEVVIRWAAGTLGLLEEAASRIARASAAHNSSHSDTEPRTSHDVSPAYIAFHQQALLFFQDAYTRFDSDLNRRVLTPLFFSAAMQCSAAIGEEITRLESIEIIIGRNKNQVVEFQPSIQHFSFLRETLLFYISSSLVYDEVATLNFFQVLRRTVSSDVKALAPAVAALPKPQNGGTTGEWEPSESEKANLLVTFERIDGIHARLTEIQSQMSQDVKTKNKTHKTRTLLSTFGMIVDGTPQAVSAVPVATSINPVAASSGGFFSRAFSSVGSVLRGAASVGQKVAAVVTCSAESSKAAAGEMPMSLTSPLADEKQTVLADIEYCLAEVGKLTVHVEKSYPTLYCRDWKHRASKAASKVMTGVESITTVFGTTK